MVIGAYIITLNVNGLNAPTKRHRLDGWMKTCACMHFHLSRQFAWCPPIVCNYFIVRKIMFPLWRETILIFYFLSGYWLWKLINIFYYCDYITITWNHCVMIGQQKNNSILYHQNYHLIEKTLITFLNPNAYQNYLGFFWKIQMPRCCFFLQSSRYVSDEQSYLKTTWWSFTFI